MTFELGKREARNKVSLRIVVPKDNVNTVEAPLTDYSDVLSGVGLFEQEYDIEVDPSVRPCSYTGTSEDAIRKVRPTQRDNRTTGRRRDNCQRRQTNRLGAQSGNHREAKRVTADMP